MIENRDRIDELVGMFQLEVAKRVCSKPGSKTYGMDIKRSSKRTFFIVS